jgi:hypothetical protein
VTPGGFAPEARVGGTVSRDSEVGAAVSALHEPGPVGFLVRRAADRLAAAKRFHEAAGAMLDLAMEAAVDDLPRLYIPKTTTEEHLAEVVRLGALFLASAKEALESIEGAHLEADLGFREEMALERDQKRRAP